jgi:CCR4-NOT transcription complex subunit 7/8
MYAQDSIELLQKSGIDFKMHQERGIDVADFGELLMTSGIVLNEDVKWISFHSGYDYGYLLKVLTCQVSTSSFSFHYICLRTMQALPREEAEFFELLRMFFPCIYDIKYLMKNQFLLNGGLQKIAETLQVVVLSIIWSDK